MDENNSNLKPKVYSYIRFSTPEQSLGDSERRQLQAVRDFANRKTLEFDETLRMADKGLSGYHGDHLKKGILGQFLNRVELGNVASGSILVVENVDRLSREGAARTLKEIIFKLWENGITLQTLSPEESYEPGCDNAPKFIGLFISMQRAFDESLRKSERISSARNTAREKARLEKKILTSRGPAWLDVIKTNNKLEFIPNEKAVKVIKTIFDLKLNGVGKGTIAKKLNIYSEWIPPKTKNKRSGKGWRESYIQKILQNPAVIGEYQPYTKQGSKRKPTGKPISNYYPQIIKPETFNTVQALFKENKGKGGKTGKACNIFKNLVKCPYCNGSMIFQDKGKPPKGGTYLICDNGRQRIKCISHKMSYEECQYLILKYCIEIKPSRVLPHPDEQTKLCESLKNKIRGHLWNILNIGKRIDNYAKQLGDDDNTYAGQRIKIEMNECEEQRKQIQSQKERDEHELNQLEKNAKALKEWQRNLETLWNSLKDKNNIELRLKLNSHLKDFIEKIDIFSLGVMEKESHKPSCILDTNLFDVGKNIESILKIKKELWTSKKRQYANFFKYLMSLSCNSKLGRFIRIYFKSGSVQEIWAKGCIPYNIDFFVNRNGDIDWKQTGEFLKSYWDEYIKKKNS